MNELTDLKNIGIKTADWLCEVGICTVEELERVGALAAYSRLKTVQPKLSLVGLYALQGALLDVHWNDLLPDMKDELKRSVGNL